MHDPFHGLPRSRLGKALLLIVGSSALWLLVRAESGESVRAELIRREGQNALYLVSVTGNHKLSIVDYASRSLKEAKAYANSGLPIEGSLTIDGSDLAFSDCSPPGVDRPAPSGQDCKFPHLATIHADGTHFRQYSSLIYPDGMCWSHDGKKLALSVSDRRENPFAVQNVYVLDLDSGRLQEAAGFDNWTTSQCWSPDDKRFVYMENKVGGIQNVLLYDTEQHESHFLASGSRPTWSPDGEWISFLVNNDSYYAVYPNGKGRKLLFKTFGVSELWWSPDSRLVAYVSVRGVFERSLSEQFAELTRLRVRRLADNSEDWFLNLGAGGVDAFQWILAPSLSANTQPR